MSELTDEQLGLRDAVRSLLAKRCDSAAVRRAIEQPRGYDEALWQVLCEQIGVAALLIPERFAWKNYTDVLESNRFSTYFVNSLLVTGTATLLALLVGVPAGYGIARMKAAKAAVVILVARITPGLSYLIPLFLLFQWLGLLGTLWPQIIIHLVVTVPGSRKADAVAR